jgi:cell division cycle 14
LNEALYDAKIFEKAGIAVYGLEFPDGSCPNDQVINRFVEIVEKFERLDQGVAVHCRAGLGRTGTLIGCYLMKKYQI